MKHKISRFIKLRRLVLISLAFKIILGVLLFMVWMDLQNQKDTLTPAQQVIFNTMQKNIAALHDELSLRKSHPASSITTDTSLLIEKLRALKAIQATLKKLSAGEKLNLSSISPFLTETNLQQLSSLQLATIPSDANLQEDLYHCFNDSYSSKTQKSSLDNFIKIEESANYNEENLVRTAVSSAQSALSEENYDSALNALAQFPKALQDATCVQDILKALAEKNHIKKLLISTQTALLKDE